MLVADELGVAETVLVFMIYVSVGVLDCVVDKLDDPLTLLVALIVTLTEGDPVLDLETLIVLDIVPLPVDVLEDV